MKPCKCDKCGIIDDSPTSGSWWQIEIHARPVVEEYEPYRLLSHYRMENEQLKKPIEGTEQRFFKTGEQLLCPTCSPYRLEPLREEFN